MRKGFTLIELIVVIAIIAILAAIIAPNAFRAIEKAKISATVEDFRSIKTGAMAYYADTGLWPADCVPPGPCTALVTAPVPAVVGWDGPYVEKWPPAAKWAGVYLLRMAADSTAIVGGYNWDGTAATPNVRVVSISLVPGSVAASATTAAGRMDANFDGTVGNTVGSVRYGLANPTTVYILVSSD